MVNGISLERFIEYKEQYKGQIESYRAYMMFREFMAEHYPMTEVGVLYNISYNEFKIIMRFLNAN